MENKAVVAGSGLALGPGKRVFLPRLRVQEYGEVLANGGVSSKNKVLWRRAHDDPVFVCVLASHECVPDSATD